MSSGGLVIDLFAGPGGWDQGLRAAGHTGPLVGVEHDHDACRTAVTAGHPRVRADVARWPASTLRGRVEGLIVSPPCTAFSLAGKGEGRELAPLLLAAIRDGDWTALRDDYDQTVWLPLEVGRWVEETGPAWVACEQVPPALPLWDAYARRLRERGWSAWCGVLNAEEYGVPQTRKRAFMLAHRTREVSPPPPSHTRYDPRLPDDGRYAGTQTLLGELRPWVSMADALGWDSGLVLRTGMNTMKHSRDPQDMVPYERSADAPAPTLDAKVGGAWKVALPGGHDDPPMSWKMLSAGRANTVGQRSRGVDEPSVTLTGKGTAAWVRERSARTVRVTVEQAAVLQGFPVGYPWHGTKTSRYRQVGNAVPPPLAAAVLAALLGITVLPVGGAGMVTGEQDTAA